ncbi:bifunctional arginine demethylase and lysyl-hydroxylase psr-1-like isoform X2 [Rhopilema esculentum]|uniref:bifunctional arginine demethylase and lysyl-hydroxylase psr-1-like isoform X2 n=1 Tax=Rhopilema esculentum TaxID=499914 RepID=UPI0031D0C163
MEKEIQTIIKEAAKGNLKPCEIKEILGIGTHKIVNQGIRLNKRILLGTAMLFGLIAFLIPQTKFGKDWIEFLEDEYCLVDHTLTSLEISRPLINCSMCKDLHHIPNVTSITKREFRQKFAYTGIPLLITNATTNWTAFKVFDFGFLKKLYNSTKAEDSEELNEGCQFFPYRTDFTSLREFFAMDEKRASLLQDQWSNCNYKVMNIIRKHYNRPEFIPDDSESSSLDWIFVGGHGKGAQMHIDYVGRPSWQAQISGKKTWTLVPPPECEAVCRSLAITVNKGDILAIDSNKWFHSTYIHPGEISITIGSEYD